MNHNIYVVVHNGLVSHVFINNSIDQPPNMSVCVVNLDDEAVDGAIREHVDTHLHNSDDLTELLIEYPQYEHIQSLFDQIMQEKI